MRQDSKAVVRLTSCLRWQFHLRTAHGNVVHESPIRKTKAEAIDDRGLFIREIAAGTERLHFAQDALGAWHGTMTARNGATLYRTVACEWRCNAAREIDVIRNAARRAVFLTEND